MTLQSYDEKHDLHGQFETCHLFHCFLKFSEKLSGIIKYLLTVTPGKQYVLWTLDSQCVFSLGSTIMAALNLQVYKCFLKFI